MNSTLLAQIGNPALGPNLQKLTGVTFFQALLPTVVTIAFVVGIILFFFMLLIGAIQWISSAGDKAAIEAARGRIANALVGIVVLFVIFAIIKVIETVFSVSILTIDIGQLRIQ